MGTSEYEWLPGCLRWLRGLRFSILGWLLFTVDCLPMWAFLVGASEVLVGHWLAPLLLVQYEFFQKANN